MKWLGNYKIPIKSWCEVVEPSAMKQVIALANHPALVKHVALMADGHAGSGMPIGGVIATKDVIIPNAVGFDGGCGVTCLSLTKDPSELTRGQIVRIREGWIQDIPVGFATREHPSCDPVFNDAPSIDIIQENLDNARLQLGTLGSGNHFIELQHGSDNLLYVMIHSGSRNIGQRVGDYYHGKAVEMCHKYHTDVPDELAFISMGDPLGRECFRAMSWLLRYAHANRSMMMKRATDVVMDVLGISKDNVWGYINTTHNIASYEEHFGEKLIIHRKGATRAYPGEDCIIPGDMGTKSYLGRGLGNKESFMSCSHGAGRVMSRTRAKKELVLADEIARMDAKGIVHGLTNISGLDEASGAYKDIDAVMEAQKDLVRIEVELRPLAVLKG